MEKETICWGCQNFSKCSWSRGIPVENWEAIPTKFKDTYSHSDTIEQRSYCVLKCPQFKADKLQPTTIAELGKITKVSTRTMFRWLNSAEGSKRMLKRLKKKGYLLRVFIDMGQNSYYLEKVEK